MTKKIMIACLMILLTGCSAIRLPSLTTPKKPETVYNWKETTSTKPKAVICNGKVVVVEDKEQTLTVGLEQSTPKLTFSQKIGKWISGLSLVGILLLLGGLILAPSATLGFLWSTLMKWKKAMKETVVAIKEVRAIDKNIELKNALNEKQSIETKKLVDDIKRII